MNKKQSCPGNCRFTATTYNFEDDPSSSVHEQLARLMFAESHIHMSGKKILDFGCGTGYNSHYIAERGSPQQVIGIDILEECIESCKQNYSANNVAFLVQDCLVHNQQLGLFDIVISSEVIEHVPDQKLFMKNIHRYLEPGGHTFISTPNRALFSLSKEKSFLNNTHIKELFFDEFQDLIRSTFSVFRIYSQIHVPYWHSAYINSLSVSNFRHALRYECFGDNIVGKLFAMLSRLLYIPLFRMHSMNYPDVRKRRFTDFDFVEGFDGRAIWFVAVCSKANADNTRPQVLAY